MAWLVVITSWGYLNSFGVFQTYYTSVLGVSQSTVSWIGSVQLWVIFVMSAFSGRALDAGLFIPAFIVGSILQLLGVFMNSLCTEFWQILLAQGICTGLGSGIIFCPSMGLVTTYFTKRRGIAVAIVTTGNSLGGAVYPVVVRQLLPKLGFAWTVRVIGFINLACLAVCLAFMRPRLPPRKSGPLFELGAFKELPYGSAVAGLSLAFGGMFFSYTYVSPSSAIISATPLTYRSDRILRFQYSWYVLRRLCQPTHHLQRRRHPSPCRHGFHSRPVHRPFERHECSSVHQRHLCFHMDRSPLSRRDVCGDRRVWFDGRCFSMPSPYDDHELEFGFVQERRQAWDGFQYIFVRWIDWSAHRWSVIDYEWRRARWISLCIARGWHSDDDWHSTVVLGKGKQGWLETNDEMLAWKIIWIYRMKTFPNTSMSHTFM